MPYELREFDESLREGCLSIQNTIIDNGESFPWDSPMDTQGFTAYFKAGEPIWCAVDGKRVLGFVHIHPNGIGRLAHIANCGYAVAEDARGQGIGRALVAKSIEVAKSMGFRGIQFNAVVSTNEVAIKLYESFGFKIIGTVPGGFRLGSKEDPSYVDRHIMFLEL